MYINRIEVKNFLAFEEELNIDFCPGVNVLIGGNATGKTTLLRALNNVHYFSIWLFGFKEPVVRVYCDGRIISELKRAVRHTLDVSSTRSVRRFYIPEKDILEHAKGLLPFIEQKKTGFDEIYKNVLIAAQDVPTQNQTDIQKSVGGKIESITGGLARRDEQDGTYYTLKANGSKVPFNNEASAYKKLGYLGLLVESGQLEPGSVLLWDEPENSLNLEIIPQFVDILLELSQSGVQIFLATHNYDLARYLDVRKDKTVPVMFHNLTKESEGRIVCDSSPRYIKLSNNLLESAGEKLYSAVIKDAMGVTDGE